MGKSYEQAICRGKTVQKKKKCLVTSVTTDEGNANLNNGIPFNTHQIVNNF